MRKYQNEVFVGGGQLLTRQSRRYAFQIPDEAFQGTLIFGDNKAAVQTDLMTGENCISTFDGCLALIRSLYLLIPVVLLKFTY